MTFFSRLVFPLCLLILISCKGSYYQPIEIRQEAMFMLDSTSTIFVFNVPTGDMNHPVGAKIEDDGDILKVYLVKAQDQSQDPKVDVPVGLVKDNSDLMSKGLKPTSYYLSLPTKGRGFRFCNQGGCGDLNTVAQATQ